jgi:hypothetical protein
MNAPCQVDWSALAAWAQAIFSVAAIIVAARLMSLEQRIRREQTLFSITGVVLLAVGALGELNIAAAARNIDNLRDFAEDADRNRLRRIARTIEAAPLYETGSMEVPGILEDVRRLLVDAEKAAAVLARTLPTHPVPDVSNFGSFWSDALDCSMRLSVEWTHAKTALRLRSWLLGFH